MPAASAGVSERGLNRGSILDRLRVLAPNPCAGSADALVRNWQFIASHPDMRVSLRRLRSLTGLSRAPAAAELIGVRQAASWTAYFIYLPDGELTAAHRFTLARLRDLDRKLLVVCAAPHAADVPAELRRMVDALWWKALPGYDFSAYAVALSAVARTAPGAELLVMNDSILGPFSDLRPLLAKAPWDLTALTASSWPENHVQSYALALRSVTPSVLRALSSVLSRRFAVNGYGSVVYLQELRLGKVAARHMTVGARWFASSPEQGDPTLVCAPSLLRQGYPFLKRSLLTRNTGFHPTDELSALLEANGHPLDGFVPVAADAKA